MAPKIMEENQIRVMMPIQPRTPFFSSMPPNCLRRGSEK